jgi:hypothetical protein
MYYDVIMRRVRVTIVAMETRQRLLYTSVSNTDCRTKKKKAFYVAGNNKKYFGLHVNFPLFLSDINQIWDCPTISLYFCPILTKFGIVRQFPFIFVR